MCSSNQPSLMRKVYRVMGELSQMENLTMEQVRMLMLPYLKSSPLLIDWFYQIFPFEKPSERLLSNSWETIEMGKDDTNYEQITLPDTEDPYGGVTCICTCHNVDNEEFKARTRHCTSCGVKVRHNLN